MKPSSSKKPSRSLLADRAHIAAIILIVLATLIVYSQTLGHGFIVGYDDADYVTKNPHVRAGPTLDSIEWAFTAFHSANWHPLTWISHMLDCRLFGLKAGGHHATNLILHLANALLLYYVLRRMTKSVRRSAFVAIVFAVHPLHVESVAWISERKDLLSALFAMLTILAYVRYAERPSLRRYTLVVLAFAAGLMSKPMLVTMPFVLLLLDYWPLGRFGAKRGLVGLVVEKLPLLVLSAASCAITVVAQHRGGALRSLEQVSLAFRVPAAAISYVTYIGKMIWPRHLAMPYLYASNVLPIWKVIASVIVLAAITSLAVLLRRKRPYLLVGWLWYVGTLVPVIGLVQVGPQMIADRYTYLPLIGLFVMIAWGVGDALGSVGVWECGSVGEKSRAGLPVLAGVVVIALTISASFQAARWRNTFTLFEYVLAVIGENYVAHNALGVAYQEEGKLDEAVAQYSKAVSLDAEFYGAYFDLGTAFMAQGRLDDAVTALSRAIAINPDFAEAYTNLGAAFGRMNRMDEAVDALRKAIELKPDYELARRNLDAALEEQARIDSAIAGFNRILASDPHNAQAHCQLGNILAGRRDFDEAIRHFREAVRSSPEYAEARRNLAMALYFAGRYPEAWREVDLCRTHGVGLNPKFIRQLSDKMPEPAR